MPDASRDKTPDAASLGHEPSRAPVQRPSSFRDSIEAATVYAELGFAPTPLRPQDKAARLRDWPTTKITPDQVPDLFKPGDGVGIVTGQLSGGLICVDLDHAIAVRIADDLLPPTGMIEGRAGKPRSHRYYRCTSVLPKSQSFKLADGSVLVEIHADRRQVAAPPSIHPSGEVRTWEAFTEPAAITTDDLEQVITRFAVVAELVAAWPKNPSTGIRHELSLALAGALLRAGWTEDHVRGAVEILCRESGDHELEDRLRAVTDTALKLQVEPDARITGWKRLLERLDAEPSVRHVLALLGQTDIVLDERPPIEMKQGDLDQIVSQVWAALNETNTPPKLFRRSNQIVRVERIDDSDKLLIHDLRRPDLLLELVERIRWYKLVPDKRTGIALQVPAAPTQTIADLLLAEEDPPLPLLTRVVGVPVFAPNGELQTQPGYHPEARVYYEPAKALLLPEIPVKPTPGEISRAKDLLLKELLGDFPFESDSDRAHAIALTLLPFVRDMIDGPTPMHMVEAPTPGTGKGKLVTVVAAISAGVRIAQPTTAPTQEEEWRKKLFTLILEGHSHIWLDNLNERLDSPSLAAALTATTFTDRVLGVTASLSAHVRTTWVATANNPVVSDEMARRIISIRIVASVELPHLREPSQFRHPDLEDWTHRHRPELITACLTLIQSWVVADRPQFRGTRLGSYEDWSAMIGGILEVVGIPGFLGNVRDHFEDAATESAVWRTFAERWWEQFGPHPVQTKDLIYYAEESGIEVRGHEEAGRATSLGSQIRKQMDSIFGGLRIGKPVKMRSGKGYRLIALDDRQWDDPGPDPATQPFYPHLPGASRPPIPNQQNAFPSAPNAISRTNGANIKE